MIAKINLPVIRSVKSPLIQILHNLLDNAMKYAKEETVPIITVETSDKGSYWGLSIQDNGIGIASEYFDKIFVIFQRLHDNKAYGGSGMGLAIV